MPARFRDVIDSSAIARSARQLILLPWFGECIRVFPLSGWEARLPVLEERLSEIDSLGYSEEESDLRRLIYGMATEVQMDGHGRLVLAQHLRDQAAIDREVYWVGGGDYIELWDPARLHERLGGEKARELRSRLAEVLRPARTEPPADPDAGTSPRGEERQPPEAPAG